MTQRFRNWCFTDFNLLDWRAIYNADDNIRYVCWGEETCPKTGKKHYQGWLQVTKQRRLSSMKKIDKAIHWEGCLGTEKHNDTYCKKDGKFTTIGKFVTQGFRSDLDGIFEEIKNGTTLYEIATENPTLYCKYRNGIEHYKQMVNDKESPEWRDIEVIVLAGDTGTGKTRLAMQEATYKINGSELNWWDGYDNDSTICIDEYDTDVSITKMLNILDGYKLRLPIKGGFTYAKWTKVYITSNVLLHLWHTQAKTEHIKALRRRITSYKIFQGDKIHDVKMDL